jgi:hypothetical protein
LGKETPAPGVVGQLMRAMSKKEGEVSDDEEEEKICDEDRGRKELNSRLGNIQKPPKADTTRVSNHYYGPVEERRRSNSN